MDQAGLQCREAQDVFLEDQTRITNQKWLRNLPVMSLLVIFSVVGLVIST